MSWGVYVQGISVQGISDRGVCVLGGKCPGGKCPGGKCLGGTCPGGFYPVTPTHIVPVSQCLLRPIMFFQRSFLGAVYWWLFDLFRYFSVS